MTEFVMPSLAPPYRVLLLGAATHGWAVAPDAERREQALPRLIATMQSWMSMGARLITTFDDDLFMVGEPRSTGFSWYLVFEVDALDTVTAMINSFREPRDGVRLDRWFRLEARVGRAFFPLEPPA